MGAGPARERARSARQDSRDVLNYRRRAITWLMAVSPWAVNRHSGMPRVLTPTRAEKLEAEWSTRLPTPKALPADEETKEIDIEEAREAPVSAMPPPPPCFCSQCGAPLRGRFCGQCGARAA